MLRTVIAILVGAVLLVGPSASGARAQANRLPLHLQYTIDAPRPEPGVFFNATNLAVGPDGTVYVADEDHYRIQYFGPSGTYLGQWGHRGAGDGQFGRINDLAIGPHGTVHVGDSHHDGRIQRFSATGRFLGAVSDVGWPRAVGPDGSIYTERYDGEGHAVVRLGPDGRELDRWGDDRWSDSIDIDVAPDGTVYVADEAGQQIEYFTADGQPLGEWDLEANEDDRIRYALQVAVGDDEVYVALGASGYARVVQYDPAGTLVQSFEPAGTISSLAVAPDGSLYYADGGQVLRYSGDGARMASWGRFTDGDAFFGIHAIGAMPDGGVLVGGRGSVLHRFDALGDRVWSTRLGTLPEHLWGLIMSISHGADGQSVVLLHRSEGPSAVVLSLDDDGRLVDSWRVEVDDRSWLQLDVAPDGSVYLLVTDKDSGATEVRHYTADGTRLLHRWTIREEAERMLGHRLAVASDGSVIVVDFDPELTLRQHAETRRLTSESQPEGKLIPTVLRYSSAGQLLDSWPLARPDEPGGIVRGNAFGVTSDARGSIYISAFIERSELNWYRAILRFDLDGEPKGEWRGEPGRLRPTDFNPRQLDISTMGRLFAVDFSYIFTESARLRVLGPSPPSAWRARYYPDETMSTWPEVQALEAPIADWGAAPPVPSLPSDGFAAELDGRLLSRGGGHRVALTAEGGVRLWIGERLVVDRWHEQPVRAVRTVPLEPGEHQVHLEYVDRGGPASVSLRWMPVGPGRRAYVPRVVTGTAGD